MPRASAVLRLAVGAIFLAASFDKLLHPQDFARIVAGYSLLPEAAVPVVAALLPWLEVLVGAALLLNICAQGAAVLACAMLLAFWSALSLNWARGLDINCGCFSSAPGEGGRMAWYFVRDSVFLCLGFALVWKLRRDDPAGRG